MVGPNVDKNGQWEGISCCQLCADIHRWGCHFQVVQWKHAGQQYAFWYIIYGRMLPLTKEAMFSSASVSLFIY